ETQKLFFQVTTANRPTGPIGAVAIAGLTNTKYNNSFLGGMIRGLLNFGITQPGWLITFGKAQVRGDYRLSPDLDEDVLRVLGTSLLMGDPSLRLLLPGMRAVRVEYPQTLSPSSTGFEVRVTDPEGNPIPEALVSLTQRGDIHLVSLTNRQGRAYFSFPAQSLEEGRATLLVWGDRIVTQVLGIEVQVPMVDLSIAEVTFDNPDGRFSAGEHLSGVLVIANSGENASEEGTIRLSSSSSALDFDQNELPLPAIDPGESGEVEFGISISRRSRFGDEVRVGIELISGDQIFPHSLNFSISRPQPALTLVDFTQGEGFIRDSGVEFRPLIANRGDETLPNGQVELFSLRREWVEVVQGRLNISSLEPYQSAYPNGSFRVRLTPQAIPGNTVPLMMVITAGQEPDVYRDTIFLADLIRPLGSDQPVGPDEYGYIAFDSYDITWDKRPVFAWREINPLIEGYEFEGFRLPLEDNGNNQDTSVVVELPFTFRYYGREFNRLVVCSNGWAAFGEENGMFIDFRNYPIPGVQGPDAQLAILWDDLVNYGGRQSGGVFIYYIEEEGVLVVEWSGMEVYSDPLHREQSFQILLYDPERWLTRTGDGEIKFQYLKAAPVRGDVTDNYYATIGIKNLDNTGGIQYAYWDRYHPNAAPLGDSLAILFTTEEALQVGSLWGKVTLLADTSQPVEGARIVLSTGAETRSDPSGEFQLDRVPHGSHSLLVTSPGLADERINFSIRAREETRLYIRMGRPVIEVPRREIGLALAPGDNNSLQALTIRNRGDGALRFRIRHRYPDGGELRYPLRMNADLSGETGDGLLAGVEMVGDRFFISGTGSLESNEDNTIFVLDRQGREVRRFSQRSQDIFGFRDLAWGGGALWGGDRVGDNLYVVALDTSGEFLQRYLLSEIGLLPDDPSEAYALTWNEDGTRLFVGFGDKDIVELGWSEDTLRVVRRFRMALPGLTLDLRGLAWNAGDEDDMPLYGLSQSSPDNRRALLVKCNPYRGGTRFVRQLALNHTENGTGLAIGFDWSVTRATLAYVADDRRSDSLRVFEIGPDARFLRYDIGWQEVMPGQDFPFPLHFSSRHLRNNQTYSLGLWIEHNSSQEPVLAVCSLRVDSAAWVGEENAPVPHYLAIEGLYPQPFNAQATIIFVLPYASEVALRLYDLQGRMVKSLFQAKLPSGRHHWLLDAQDLPTGLYLIRLESPWGNLSRKVLLIR
ncbi:MAG: carboxypeptidase regulatory-like domain-containing protein, partial [bacterium]